MLQNGTVFVVEPLERYEITRLIEDKGGSAFGQTRCIDQYHHNLLGLATQRREKVESCTWGENDFRQQRQYVRILVSSSACVCILFVPGYAWSRPTIAVHVYTADIGRLPGTTNLFAVISPRRVQLGGGK